MKRGRSSRRRRRALQSLWAAKAPPPDTDEKGASDIESQRERGREEAAGGDRGAPVRRRERRREDESEGAAAFCDHTVRLRPLHQLHPPLSASEPHADPGGAAGTALLESGRFVAAAGRSGLPVPKCQNKRFELRQEETF